jgi:hypothetical protein
MKNLTKLLLFATLFIVSINTANGQDKYMAVVSQEGNLSFRITISDFYFYISQGGKITGYGSFVNGNISYNVYGKVDRIGSTNISYDVYNKINRVGTTNISYDVSGRVNRIGTISISYNVYDKISRFSNENVSYNVYDKVDKIGSASISYNINGNVGRISDTEGFVIFRPKTDGDND